MKINNAILKLDRESSRAAQMALKHMDLDRGHDVLVEAYASFESRIAAQDLLMVYKSPIIKMYRRKVNDPPFKGTAKACPLLDDVRQLRPGKLRTSWRQGGLVRVAGEGPGLQLLTELYSCLESSMAGSPTFRTSELLKMADNLSPSFKAGKFPFHANDVPFDATGIGVIWLSPPIPVLSACWA
ncbi:hypothetical protein CYMTET_24236 [Cymbomonas tetramitiformis]|uniref:Uncharacterized protein n=1 Tax=Cymbomonas tetramitiformis TaxID=36881 RepID=A0AAE0L035_9CHLO|nr:hypothetical protein CYMTET_24236 [Cymbomonas tetramitiformis]